MYQKLHGLRASRAVIRYLWWLVILFWVFGSRRSNRVFRMIEPLENFGQNSTGTIDTKCHKTVRRNLSSKIQCFIQQTQMSQAFKFVVWIIFWDFWETGYCVLAVWLKNMQFWIDHKILQNYINELIYFTFSQYLIQNILLGGLLANLLAKATC